MEQRCCDCGQAVKRARLQRRGDSTKGAGSCGGGTVDDRYPDTAGEAAAAPGGVPATAPATAAGVGRVDDCTSQPDAGAYIKGTRLVIGGWFQACRGCNEPTARTFQIAGRDVPFCPRCTSKYEAMVSGAPPPGIEADPSIEPLCYHLPKLLGAVPPLAPAARRDFCDRLVLRQDDAWRGLIKTSTNTTTTALATASGATGIRAPPAAGGSRAVGAAAVVEPGTDCGA